MVIKTMNQKFKDELVHNQNNFIQINQEQENMKKEVEEEYRKNQENFVEEKEKLVFRYDDLLDYELNKKERIEEDNKKLMERQVEHNKRLLEAGEQELERLT